MGSPEDTEGRCEMGGADKEPTCDRHRRHRGTMWDGWRRERAYMGSPEKTQRDDVGWVETTRSAREDTEGRCGIGGDDKEPTRIANEGSMWGADTALTEARIARIIISDNVSTV